MNIITAFVDKWDQASPAIKRKLIKPDVLFNLFLQRLSLILGMGRALGSPSHLTIEPTNLCPGRCIACPTGLGTLKRAQGNMPFEDFKKIIDQLSRYLLKIDIYWMGESMVNKEIFKMIRYAKSKDIIVHISTIGIISGPDVISELVLSGIDAVTVPIDGATEETYQRYRRGSSLEKASGFVRGLVAFRNKKGLSRPRVILQSVVMKHNQHETEKVKELAFSLGVDDIFIKPFRIDRGFDPSKDTELLDCIPEGHETTNYIIEDGKVIWKEGVLNKCSPLWTTTAISWDGNVCPLCCDTQNENVFGNALKKDFKDIWNNGKYMAFRRQVLSDKSKIPLCSFCSGNK
jgi:MoaA/NifB/PqqE/SkfB family radical SAM enzyme